MYRLQQIDRFGLNDINVLLKKKKTYDVKCNIIKSQFRTLDDLQINKSCRAYYLTEICNFFVLFCKICTKRDKITFNLSILVDCITQKKLFQKLRGQINSIEQLRERNGKTSVLRRTMRH